MTPRFYIQCAVLLCLFTGGTLRAQQSPYTVFYRANWQFINPAAIDRSHYLTRNHREMVLSAGARQQWIGLEGAPLLYFVSAEYCPHQASGEFPGDKFGVTAFSDKTDAIGTYGLYGNYSRYIPLPYTEGHVLHLGLGVGANLYQVDWDKIRLANNNDPLRNAYEGQFFVDFSIGAMYRIQKKFYIGLSMPQIFTLSFQEKNDATGRFRKEKVPYVYLTVGGFIQRGEYSYKGKMTEETTIVVEPSAIVRYATGIAYSTLLNNFPLSIDLNLRVHYNQRFWVGGGYGTNGLLNAEVGFGGFLENDNKWNIGVSYGVPVGKKYLSLGHSAELTMGYYFN